MRPASPCSARAALCVAITSLALAGVGCNALLGIDEYRLGPDGAPPPPIDAPVDAPPDGQPLDGPPPDGMPPELYLGYRDDLGGEFDVPADFLWAIDIMVPEAITLDRLGFVSKSAPGATVTLGLYADEMGQPGNLLAPVLGGVAVREGPCEGDIMDRRLQPGRYWFAMVSDAAVTLGYGAPNVTHYYVDYLHTEPLPGAFPGASEGVDLALNVYLVVKP
jgi:hypothetical protein